jgi:hypothetical protein
MNLKWKESNYRALFVIGIAFIGAGISLAAAGLITTGVSILSIGIVFFVIGISNRKKWVYSKSYQQSDLAEDHKELT